MLTALLLFWQELNFVLNSRFNSQLILPRFTKR